jgi:quercetin dioxygenase-like cupin family protein
MAEIFHIDEHELPWIDVDDDPNAEIGKIRVKPLTAGVTTATRVQYIEYAPDYLDPMHSHAEGEVFIVDQGELWLDDARNGPGSILCIPRDAPYAVRSGPEGARFFRVVVP